MKKPLFFLSLLFLVLIFSVAFIQPKSTFAQSLYLRVITEDTPFYKNLEDAEPLFFLPYTYYVKIIEKGDAFSHVECQAHGNTPAIDGYVPTSMLFYDGLEVVEPYIKLLVKTATTALLFDDCNLTSPSQYIFAEREMNYYGKYVNQSGFIVYYVSYNNRLGYVKEADIYPFSITKHPNELTFLQPETPPVSEQNPQNNSSTDSTLSIKIIIIACLVFSGIIALIFAIKNKGETSSAVTFYDENDYE